MPPGLRAFGSASKGELLKTMFFPVTVAQDAIGWVPNMIISGMPVSYLANGNHLLCGIVGALPPNINLASAAIYLVTAGQANTNNMHLDITCYTSQDGEAFGAHGSTTELAPFNTAATILDYIDIINLFGVPMIANSILHVTCAYRAADAHAATNVFIIGILITWT